MSISIGTSTVGNPSSDPLGLDGAGLSGITGPALHNPNSRPSQLPQLLPNDSNPATQSGTDPDASTSGVEAGAVDPLTPQGLTASGSAALSTVIQTVTSTLNSIHAGNGPAADLPAKAAANPAADAGVTQLSQLIQSTGFKLLLQLLGSSSATAEPNLANLLHGSGEDATITATPAESTAPGTANPRPAAAFNDIDPAPYFRKLIGELESTYKTVPEDDSAQSASDFNASELDLFLKWLSLNGSNSVTATA
jgi:hypothetical protein